VSTRATTEGAMGRAPGRRAARALRGGVRRSWGSRQRQDGQTSCRGAAPGDGFRCTTNTCGAGRGSWRTTRRMNARWAIACGSRRAAVVASQALGGAGRSSRGPPRSERRPGAAFGAQGEVDGHDPDADDPGGCRQLRRQADLLHPYARPLHQLLRADRRCDHGQRQGSESPRGTSRRGRWSRRSSCG